MTQFIDVVSSLLFPLSPKESPFLPTSFLFLFSPSFALGVFQSKGRKEKKEKRKDENPEEVKKDKKGRQNNEK
jgi:hypothetical protein